MDALFGHVMLWGRDQGYQWFNFGMAPLSGIEGVRRADLWSKVTHFVYRHGEPLYNFQGLRTYKEKFHPVWSPRYLAYPGGLALARVLADVTAHAIRHLVRHTEDGGLYHCVASGETNWNSYEK